MAQQEPVSPQEIAERLPIPPAGEEDIFPPAPGLWTRARRSSLVRHLLFDPSTALGTLIVLAAVLLALFGPMITPYSPIAPDYNSMASAPSHAHLFGTDLIGYDVFSRVLAGARLSIGAAAILLAIAVVIGLVLGGIAGYFGGWADEIIMRLTDMFLAFPALILALAVAASLGRSLTSAMIALSMAFWPWYARLLRGQVLSLKKRDYVEAARVIGGSNLTVMRRHILPNAMGPIVVELSMDMGFAVLATSALSFIGVGAQPPSPEWGAMIVAGRDYIQTAWWLAFFPGLALSLTVLGFNLLGDGLRDALDPRSGYNRG